MAQRLSFRGPPAPGDFQPRLEPGIYFHCDECDAYTAKEEWIEHEEDGECGMCAEEGEDSGIGSKIRIVAITSDDQRKDERYAGKVNALHVYEDDDGFEEE